MPGAQTAAVTDALGPARRFLSSYGHPGKIESQIDEAPRGSGAAEAKGPAALTETDSGQAEEACLRAAGLMSQEKMGRTPTVHSFRHFFASACAQSGVPKQVVQRWLGDADSEMINRYFHLREEQSSQLIARVDFSGGGSVASTAPGSELTAGAQKQ